ncbi:MAG: DUF2062 domain-containing protein [Bacteroidetes bacterium]|nr:DUF2062 domain-containing protein [Bacteroidota bacterium]
MKKLLNRIKYFFNNKYLAPLIKLLKQGITPKEIALGVAGAITLGIFPVLGSTTILTTAFALVFRLNLPLIQLINFSVYPLQLIFFIPFMKLGEHIFRYATLNYSFAEIIEMLSNDLGGTIEMLWSVSMQGIGAWFVTAPFLGILLFLLLKRVFTTISNKMKKDVT